MSLRRSATLSGCPSETEFGGEQEFACIAHGWFLSRRGGPARIGRRPVCDGKALGGQDVGLHTMRAVAGPPGLGSPVRRPGPTCSRTPARSVSSSRRARPPPRTVEPVLIGGEEGVRPVTFQQCAVSMVSTRGGMPAPPAQPHAGPNERVAPPLFGPEEHMRVDMAAPSVGLPAKLPASVGSSRASFMSCGRSDGDAPLPKWTPAKVIAIGAVIGQAGQFEEHGRRQQAGFGQPGDRRRPPR